MKRVYANLLITLTALLLVACSEDNPTPTLTIPDVPTEQPAPTQSLPTVVINPTVSNPPPPIIETAPTATLAIPPTVTPLITSTPGPITLLAPGDFGENRNPLTGEIVTDAANLDRRPLAIKISNSPPQWVWPQSGINDSDLLFEHITEAGITRFTMIVYSKSPPEVGPIRSGRLIDLELPAMYDAALVYSGSSDGVRHLLFRSDFLSRILLATEPGYYRTGEDEPWEHTLYGTPELLWDNLEEKGQNSRPQFKTFMTFTEEPPAGGQPVSVVTLEYRWELAEWKYDPGRGRFLRWSDGQPHIDANNGEQASAANVVIIIANHVENLSICESLIDGVCQGFSVEIQISGSGPAIVMRDGQRYEGTWQRVNRDEMFTFYGPDGQPLPLQIGNTWFQVIPNTSVVPLSLVP